MESKTSRNSIILKNLNSPFIEQAIFILKKGNDESVFGDDIIDEAQKIIDKFIKRRQKSNYWYKKVKALLYITPLIGTIVFATVMIIRHL